MCHWVLIEVLSANESTCDSFTLVSLGKIIMYTCLFITFSNQKDLL